MGNKNKKEEKSRASMILGVLSIISGLVVPVLGATLGIIGLSIKKEKGKEDRDKVLNIVGICLSVVSAMIWAYLYP